MRPNRLVPLIIIPAAALALAGCAPGTDYNAVCIDPRTDQILPDRYCNQDRASSSWYYLPGSVYYGHDDTYWTSPGRTVTGVTGGSYAPPKATSSDRSIRYGTTSSAKTTTVYAQPAGTGNGKTSGTITGSDRSLTAKKSTPIWGSPSKSKSVFGSSSSYKSSSSSSFKSYSTRR